MERVFELYDKWAKMLRDPNFRWQLVTENIYAKELNRIHPLKQRQVEAICSLAKQNPIVKKIAAFDVPKIEMEDSDFEYKNLAINPADCTVVCCKDNEGCDTGLECNTKPIVDAGFYLGSTVYRVGYIMRGGSSCVYQGEEWEKCFLQKQEFEDYIKTRKWACAPGEDNECLYENDECVPDN